ncbi:unnamed protein product [Rhodiola kirilowii]
MVFELNKKLNETVASLTGEKDKPWQEVEVLVAQKVEQQDEVMTLKAQMIEMNKERSSLLSQKVELLGAVSSLKRDRHAATMEEFSWFKRVVKVMNSGSKNLDAILKSQRIEDGHRGLWFKSESSSAKTMFVKTELKPMLRLGQKMNQDLEKCPSNQRRKKPRAT